MSKQQQDGSKAARYDEAFKREAVSLMLCAARRAEGI